jgi:hypothetical protein
LEDLDPIPPRSESFKLLIITMSHVAVEVHDRLFDTPNQQEHTLAESLVSSCWLLQARVACPGMSRHHRPLATKCCALVVTAPALGHAAVAMSCCRARASACRSVQTKQQDQHSSAHPAGHASGVPAHALCWLKSPTCAQHQTNS